MRVQAPQSLLQRGRAERLLGQRVQFGALVGAQAVAEPLRCGGALRQGIQQLVHIAGILREEVTVLGHEIVEVPLGVLAAGMLVQQVIEVVKHVGDALAVLVGGAFQRLLHAGEPLVEHLPAQQILDLLVLFAGLAAAPVVVGQLLHRLGRRRGQRLELQFAEPGVVVQRPGQLLALRQHRLVEQPLDLLQGAVKVVAGQQFPTPTVGFGSQFVGTCHVLGATPQQLGQGPPRRRALHDVLADLLQRLPQVDRRRQRVGAAGVAGVPRGPPVPMFSHRRFRPLRTPCRSAWPDTTLPAPIRRQRPVRRPTARPGAP